MDKITGTALTELLEKTRPQATSKKPAITIYLPMHTSAAPPHLTENFIRLKNLIHEAKALLEQQHPGHALARSLDKHFETIIADSAFAESSAPGLLICARDASLHVFQLPIDTEAYVAIDTVFHIAPLLGLIHDSQAFYLLALSQHRPQLYRGGAYELQPAGITLPESLESALRLDENNQKGEQSQSAGGSSMKTSVFNGRGGARNPQEADRMRFWRLIDHAVLSGTDTTWPLLLAGTDAEVAEYRSLSKYPRVLQTSLSGNFEHADLRVAFAKAAQIIQAEIVEPKHQQAIAAYERLKGSGNKLAAHEDSAIQAAAEAGRVDTLLIGLNRLTADTVNDTVRPVTRITFPHGNLRRAINTIALAVKHTSGKVIVLDESRIPEPRPLAAILRY